jgi:Flp pilus assembly protein TadG
MASISDRLTAKKVLLRARRRLPKFLRRFVRHQRGVAAIEFALVVVPFIAMLFAIIETAIVFFASQVLETAVAESARLILTGQAQSGGFNQTTFKAEVCKRISGLFNCSGGIYVDVRTFADFSAVSMTSPIDGNGNLVNNFVYQPGTAGQIVVVRLLYQWPIYMQIWNPLLTNMSGNKRLLVATAAFRNEPF